MKLLIYNTQILDKINKIVLISQYKTHKTNCNTCNISFYKEYEYKNIIITDLDIHNFINHNLIDIDLYEKICEIKIKNYDIKFLKLHTNDLNIIDGLYDSGSNNIYIDFEKNIKNTKKTIYSEHYGFINFELDKMAKITVLNKMKNEIEDLFTPENTIEFSTQEYIFHTHPRFTNLGVRSYIIYEIPSINDILHFINFYNLGKLKCSIIITPEGLYCIRKNKWFNEKIKIDKNIFYCKIQNAIDNCYEIINKKYSKKKITFNYFYEKIMPDLEIIKILNYELEFFNITIDFYGRNLLQNKYVLTSIYIPN